MSKVGRPNKNTRDVRRALLEAARLLFAKHKYENLTIRKIAEHAGVNSALINYHFDNKLGLYKTMMFDLVSEVDANIQSGLQDHAFSPSYFFEAYNAAMLKTPDFPLLMVNELVIGEGYCRKALLEHIDSTLITSIEHYRQKLIAQDELKMTCDPIQFRISILSMCWGSWVLQPCLATLEGIEYTEDFVSKLTAQQEQIFQHGLLK